MGNGLHCLQVVIAMRGKNSAMLESFYCKGKFWVYIFIILPTAGLALLKDGGRMVYSTCSMNPVENEAVVAEVIYQFMQLYF